MVYTPMSRPSSVVVVRAQVAVMVNAARLPPGVTVALPAQQAGSVALATPSGSSTRYNPHSTPARAAWYARTPCTSTPAELCCSVVTVSSAAPSTASTTRIKIAEARLKPFCALRDIGNVHLLQQIDALGP